MKTLERQIKSKKQMGKFNTIEEASQYKVNIANEILSRVKNWDEFSKANGSSKQ
jgi:hypothetical protein